MGFSKVERRLLTAILIVDVPLLHSEVLVVIQQVFTHACIGGECIFFPAVRPSAPCIGELPFPVGFSYPAFQARGIICVQTLFAPMLCGS